MKTFASAVLVLAVTSRAYAILDLPSKIIRDENPTLVKRQDKGNMTMHKPVDFMSSGSCNDACKTDGFWVSALHGPSCYCGYAYPPDKDATDDKKCNYPCAGYDLEACGGLGQPGYYSVFNTGVNVEALPLPDSSTSTPQKTTAPQTQNQPTALTAANPAPQSTAPTTSDAPQQGGGSSTNTASIAAGAVAGVVGLAAVIGGIIFFIRRRRNSEIEEEHRRNAAVSAFINGPKPPGSSGSVSMADARLDPVMANRRMSDGSIADNQDYSRRILRVTNA